MFPGRSDNQAIIILILPVLLFVLSGTISGAEPTPANKPPVKSVNPRPPLKPATIDHKSRSTKGARKVYQYRVSLENVARRQGDVTVAGVSWYCKKHRCTSQMRRPDPRVDTCRALAKLVGKVRSYGNDTRKLNAHQLKQCNEVVRIAPSTNVKRKQPATRMVAPVARSASRAPAPKVMVKSDRKVYPLWRVQHSRRVLPRPELLDSQGKDCNDSDPNIHPNQPESRCDGVDDNCNGEIDEGLRITAYRDRDHDLFGDPNSGFLACPRDVVGELTNNNFDCNDNDPRVNPQAGNCP